MAAGQHHKLEMGNRTCMDVEYGIPDPLGVDTGLQHICESC